MDKYPIKLGVMTLPFRKYAEDGGVEVVHHEVNVVATNKETDRATCIVVEKDGKYADFYYNGSEGCFKQLSEEGDVLINEDIHGPLDEPIGSWEYEEFGETPEVILKNGVSDELFKELRND